MSLAPLMEASPIIQIHAISAIFALGLGPFILFSKKGHALHKLLGRIWGMAMIGTIASSYFIFGIGLWGPFSPIHLFSLYSTYALISGIYFARTGQITRHKHAMKGLYFGGLIVAGTLTFMPGRIMNRVLFGEPNEIGFYSVIAIVIVGIALIKARKSLANNIIFLKTGKSSV